MTMSLSEIKLNYNYLVNEDNRPDAIYQINQLTQAIGAVMSYAYWPLMHYTELHITTCNPHRFWPEPLEVIASESAGLFGNVIPEQYVYINRFGTLVEQTRRGEGVVKDLGLIALHLPAQANVRLAAIWQSLDSLLRLILYA